MKSSSDSHYRPDIDGLRAIAVTAVVLFHSGLGIFPGGYTGVDIFFVISGYLITSIIQREINSNSFSLTNFWERRIRRIVPPLVVVLLFTMVGAWLWLLPGELREYAQSLAAQSVFVSNLFFWTKSGYFATAAELKPLQHTWSLAIEEQFYLLFPWLLLLISNYLKKYRLYLLTALALLSFFLSLDWILSAPDMAFYWLPPRAWELLLGSLLVYLPTMRDGLKVTTGMSLTGLILILAAFITYTPETRFPGLAALPPCLGTALIIYAHKGNGRSLVYQILSRKPVVFIGLISYSLYLWHWPLFAFARNIAVGELTSKTSLSLIALSLILATASFKLVEAPVRAGKILSSRRSLFCAALLAMLFFASTGVIGHIANGFPQRLEPAAQKMATGFVYTNPRRWECLFTHRGKFASEKICKVGGDEADSSNHGKMDFLVVGDSHANSLMPLIDRLAKEQGVVGLYPIYNGCPPILNIYRSDAGEKHRCHLFNTEILQQIKSQNIKNVLLIGRWSFYALDGVIDQTDSSGNRPRNWHKKERLTQNESKPLVSQGLRAFINELPSGVRVSILHQIPEQMTLVTPQYLAKRLQLGDDLDNFGIALETHLKRQSFANKLIEDLAEESDHVKAINLDGYLCNQTFCPAAKDGGSMYRDFNHISTYGSQFVAQGFREFFSDVILLKQ